MSADETATACPVCGYPDLTEPPWTEGAGSQEICPLCRTQFGYDDAAGGDEAKRADVYARLRTEWKARSLAQANPAELRAEIDRLTVAEEALRANLKHRTQERDAARAQGRGWYDRATRAEAERDAATVAAAGPVFEDQQLRAEIETLRHRVARLTERNEQLELDYAASLGVFARIRDGAEAAEARLDAVSAQLRQLHYVHPVGGDCGECGQPMPCDTLFVLDRAAATGTDPEAEAT